jgi:hypothetical protein
MGTKTKIILSALAAAIVFYPLEVTYLDKAYARVKNEIKATGIPSKLEELSKRVDGQFDLIGEGVEALITPESAKRVINAPREMFVIGTLGDHDNLWGVYSDGDYPHDTEAYAAFNEAVQSDPRNARVMERITDHNGAVLLGRIGGRYLDPDTLYAPH